jgi:hypothetical protein
MAAPTYRAADRTYTGPSMMSIKRCLVGLGLLALPGLGCGSSSDGPVTYTLDQGSNQVPVGYVAPIGPFSVPSGAIISYSIRDTPEGFGADSMTFAIDPGAYAYLSGSSVTASTPPLPGGSYYLDITCDNIADDCFFDDQITATY